MRAQAGAPAARMWLKRTGWLVLIWAASVCALGLCALLLRLLMRGVGMSP